jgi:predicted enzyme related to lactoylglutathione lyase
MSISTTLVTGVDFVSLPTRNFEAATEFYGTVLGLQRSSVWQRPGQEAVGAEFETGTVTIALVVSERLGIEFQPNHVPVALHVEDVEAARAELESRGISFAADTIDSGVCHMAHFKDPDGNALMLHHRYAPRAPEA